MKNIHFILIIIGIACLFSCKEERLEEKGFQVGPTSEATEEDRGTWINQDSLKFETRPSNVLLTTAPNIRLTTIYKVNFNKDKLVQIVFTEIILIMRIQKVMNGITISCLESKRFTVTIW